MSRLSHREIWTDIRLFLFAHIGLPLMIKSPSMIVRMPADSKELIERWSLSVRIWCLFFKFCVLDWSSDVDFLCKYQANMQCIKLAERLPALCYESSAFQSVWYRDNRGFRSHFFRDPT
jgi:hypothetical protein